MITAGSLRPSASNPFQGFTQTPLTESSTPRMTSSTKTSPALPLSVVGFRRGVGASVGIDKRRTEPVPIYPADKRAVLTLSTFLTGRTVENLYRVSIISHLPGFQLVGKGPTHRLYHPP